MGRGRTTTGMVTACLIATTNQLEEAVLRGDVPFVAPRGDDSDSDSEEGSDDGRMDEMDGFDESLAYQQG